MQSFHQKVVVITGAGSGIGRELAYQLAAAGAILALNDWNETTLAETFAALPATSQGLHQAFDVGDRVAVEDFAQRVQRELGQVDLVINNAGLTLEQKTVSQLSIADFERVIQVNLWGVIYSTLAFLPYLRQRPEAGLVNVSSVFGLMGYPTQLPYVVSKFGVRGFTETLRIELAHSSVYVGCVHPGGIRTNIVNNIETDDARSRDRFAQTFERAARTTSAEAAHTIISGIQQRRKRILIGRDARLIDFFTRLLPNSYEKQLLKWFDAKRFER